MILTVDIDKKSVLLPGISLYLELPQVGYDIGFLVIVKLEL